MKRKNTDSFEVPVREICPMEVLQALSRPVQLLLHLNQRAAGKVKLRTSPSLLTSLFLMYSMIFPCAIHSETVTNCPFPMSPLTPISFKTFGWDSVLQRTTSLQNC